MNIQVPPTSYVVTPTNEGEWHHNPNSDFVFAYYDKAWPEDFRKEVGKAFKIAQSMSETIKDAVRDTSGQEVVNGLYVLDKKAMIKAMNSIKGMGETGADTSSESGTGTAATITKEFFAAALAGLGGDVAPMSEYLTKAMGDIQAEAKTKKSDRDFGTIVGMVSGDPDLDVVSISFKYVHSAGKTSEWFVSVKCASVEHHSYSYSYDYVDFNFNAPN